MGALDCSLSNKAIEQLDVKWEACFQQFLSAVSKKRRHDTSDSSERESGDDDDESQRCPNKNSAGEKKRKRNLRDAKWAS